jgi:hypothetical protein
MTAWPTVRLSELIRHRKGSITIDDATTYKLCRVQLHRRGVILREQRSGAAIRTKKQQVCRAGDFLVAEMDAKVGGYGFVPPELDGAIVSSHYFLFELDETRLWPGFLEVVAQAEILQRQIVAKGSTNYAAIRPASVLGWEIPLPPLAVQKRLAANFVHARAALASAEREIAHQEDLVAKLKQAILQEAITGRLTAGWRAANPTVEPAPQLLARIRAEKARLVAAKKLRPEKPLPPIPESEFPFAVPHGWEWCAATYPAYLIPDRDKKIPTSKILPRGKFPVVDQGKVLIRGFTDNAECVIKLDGPIVLFGDHTRESKYIDFDFVVGADGVKLLRPILISPRFYHLAISSVRIEVKNYARHFKFLKEAFIPLPPLQEQTEIVARVEALMERCRELEAEIARSRAQAEALLQAVLREAFAPAAAAAGTHVES